MAVASKFLAVGAAVPAARAGVGAVATQAWPTSPTGPTVLGAAAPTAAPRRTTLDAVTGARRLRDHRQARRRRRGRPARRRTPASECLPWAGGATGDGYAIQGNILAGPEVVDGDGAGVARLGPAAALGERLLAALLAGDRAGGDRRGRQSAALLVVTPDGGYGGGSDVLVDLRVDDHPDPVPELGRLLDLHDAVLRPAGPGRLPAAGGRRSPPRSRAALDRGRPPPLTARRPLSRPRRLGRRGEPRGAAGPGAHRPGGPRPAAARRAAAGDRRTVLAVDAGTTGVTALLVDDDGRVAARGYQEFPQHFPRRRLGRARAGGDLAGDAGRGAATALAGAGGVTAPAASGSRTSARPWCSGTARRSARRRRAIVWQDRRTAALCDQLRADGHEPRVHELTGLRLDPYFSATKLSWLAANDPHTWAGVTPAGWRSARSTPTWWPG